MMKQSWKTWEVWAGMFSKEWKQMRIESQVLGAGLSSLTSQPSEPMECQVSSRVRLGVGEDMWKTAPHPHILGHLHLLLHGTGLLARHHPHPYLHQLDGQAGRGGGGHVEDSPTFTDQPGQYKN